MILHFSLRRFEFLWMNANGPRLGSVQHLAEPFYLKDSDSLREQLSFASYIAVCFLAAVSYIFLPFLITLPSKP